MKHILVTGATGKVGAQFIRRVLDSADHRDLTIRALCHNRVPDPHHRIEIAKGSIADRDSVRAAMRGITHVVHCATCKETPDQVMEMFPETYAVGAQFGVVLVPVQHSASQDNDDTTSANRAIEVATFRNDLGYSDGRHPDHVRFSQHPREDVARRDFTINAMMLDPV